MQCLDVVDKGATFPCFSKVLKEHLETNEHTKFLRRQRKHTKTHLIQFQLFILNERTCSQRNFHGRLLSIQLHFSDRNYLNNRVFLSRNYQLIVAPQKFDVLKTNICPRGEASRANLLVLRTSNFQGVTRHKHSIVFIVHH